jgi:aldehyde dehydrogenase (NAD+)
MDGNRHSLDGMRSFFDSGRTRPAAFRKQVLARLASGIAEHESEIMEALRADLGKPAIEAYASEVGFILNDIRHALRHIDSWMRPARHRTPFLLQPGRSIVRPEPRGLVLIIGTWNYPFQLLFSPLLAALAAGNCAVLKPSEYAPNVAGAVARLAGDVFDADHVRVVEGDAAAAIELQSLPFDHVFFTGSTAVGRKVMEAAARRLVPVTLELGGKCPAIVCDDADIGVAARRIARGKFMNAGQTCVATDHVWVCATRFRELVTALKEAIVSFYGADPRKSPDYARMINTHHAGRVAGYLAGQRVIFGGEHDVEERYVAPTLVENPALDSALMQEEIFGPVLPVLHYDDIDQVMRELRGRPKPLALYVFSGSREKAEKIISRVPSGGVCVNDTVNQLLVPGLPFGGVGESGMGAYHGRAGFDTFTHYRSILKRGTWPDARSFYPPWDVSLQLFRRIYRLFG